VTSFFEWQGAGRFDPPRGAAMAQTPRVAALWFGFDRETFYLRVDPAAPAAPAAGSDGGGDPLAPLRGTRLVVAFSAEGRELEAEVSVDRVDLPELRELRPAPRELGRGDAFARLEMLELAILFKQLGLAPRTPFNLVVRLYEGEVLLARYPAEGHLALAVPDDSFEAENWSA
jgi:hypothetical protein